MNKMLRAGAAILLAGFTAPAFAAELSANISATSNYIWRGVTQTGDEAAVQGGFDYNHDSGFYLGTWTSNLSDNNYEIDFYGGYVFPAGQSGIELDVGLITYQYPNTSSASFEEVYVGADLGNNFTAKFSADFDNKNYYLEGAYTTPIVGGYDLGLHVGSYSRDKVPDYLDFSATLSKGEFSFMLSFTDDDIDAGNPTDNYRVAVSWGKSL